MSNGKDEIDNLEFTVSEWARYTVWALRVEMVKRKVGKTGALMRSFEYRMKKGPTGTPSGVTLGFLYHGKFVDMGVGKGVKLENVKGNAEVWRAMTRDERVGRNRRRPKKWYSRTMYYEYQRLAEILRDKYALAIPARFETTLSEKIQIKL
jgi:hypothetical protein